MSVSTAFLAELKHEASQTRKMIERLPTDRLDWRPHEKSMKLGRLATHIAQLPFWIVRILASDDFDISAGNFNPEGKESTEAILQVFDEQLAEAVGALELASDEKMDAIWTLRRGEHKVFQLPRKIALRNMAYNHLYHHRGQLSVYLRLIDVAVPGMYGPTADESM